MYTKECESRLEALNISSRHNRNLFIFFIIVESYVFLTISGVTDEMLFLSENEVPLPFMNLHLPLFGFFLIAPLLLVAFHFNILFNLSKHYKKAKAYEAAKTRYSNHRKELELDVFPFIFNYLFISEKQKNSFIFVRVITWLLVFLLPFTTIVCVQIVFSGYHSLATTFFHFILLLFDSVILYIYWYKITKHIVREYQGKSWLREKIADYSKLIGRVFSILTIVLLVLFNAINLYNTYRIDTEKINRDAFYDYKDWWFHKLLFPYLNLKEEKLVNIPDEKIIADYLLLGKSREEAIARHTEPLTINNRDFQFANFSNTLLVKVALDNVKMNNAKLVNTDFGGSKLTNVKFNYANLEKAKFTHSSLGNVDFRGAYLKDTKFIETTHRKSNFIGTYLYLINFSGSDITESNFIGSFLDGVDFSGAVLYKVNFSGADLNMNGFGGSIIEKSLFLYTKLNKQFFEDSIIIGTSDRDVFLSDLALVSSFAGSDVGDFAFSNSFVINTELPKGDFIKLDSIFTNNEIIDGVRINNKEELNQSLNDFPENIWLDWLGHNFLRKQFQEKLQKIKIQLIGPDRFPDTSDEKRKQILNEMIGEKTRVVCKGRIYVAEGMLQQFQHTFPFSGNLRKDLAFITKNILDRVENDEKCQLRLEELKKRGKVDLKELRIKLEDQLQRDKEWEESFKVTMEMLERKHPINNP